MDPKILSIGDGLVLSDSEDGSSADICINNNGHSGSIRFGNLSIVSVIISLSENIHQDGISHMYYVTRSGLYP